MPIYVYEILDKKGEGTGQTIEIVQSMKDKALTKDPASGRSIRRIILPPNIAGRWSDLTKSGALSNKNLERLGFTKYERKGKGYMERVAGSEGPQSLSLDD